MEFRANERNAPLGIGGLVPAVFVLAACLCCPIRADGDHSTQSVETASASPKPADDPTADDEVIELVQVEAEIPVASGPTNEPTKGDATAPTPPANAPHANAVSLPAINAAVILPENPAPTMTTTEKRGERPSHVAEHAADLREVRTPDDRVAAAVAVLPQRKPGDADPNIVRVSCPGCGSNYGLPASSLFNASSLSAGSTTSFGCPSCGERCVAVDSAGCCVTQCFPGMETCQPYHDSSLMRRFVGVLYEIICCPDPFYELTGPHWTPAAYAGMFVNHAQPRSQTLLRWDAGQGVSLPDRNEYFWAQANGTGLGPNPALYTAAVNAAGAAADPDNFVPVLPRGSKSLHYDQLNMYIETATKSGKFSAFVNTPYRSVDPDFNFRHGGFSDLTIGTKSLVFDRELIQVTLQLTNYVPAGVSINGTGTGHYTIEPAVLYMCKLSNNLYLEGEVAEWIPFGALYSGGILHAHHSLNGVLWRLNSDVELISTLELGVWAFQGGFYTNPDTLLPESSSGGRYYNLGTGFRLAFRKSLDFGIGAAFALNDPNWAKQLYRLEMRVMY